MGGKRVKVDVGDTYGRLTVISVKGFDSEVLCVCGRIKLIKNANLKKSKSCGKCPSKWLVGQKFGKLTAIRPAGYLKDTCHVWVCECDCGKLKEVTSNALCTGNTKTCGCSKFDRPFKDISGKVIGKLTAQRPTGVKSNNGDMIWEFSCDCGNTKKITIGNFNGGYTKSCGCSYTEAARSRENFHGMQKSCSYQSWRKMRERCNNPNDDLYIRYGAQGIYVCKEWNDSFKTFYEDMGDCPEGFTIDRIDNTKGYFKGNCRWSSNYVQSRNKKSTTGTSIYKGVQFEESSQSWIVTMTLGSIKSKKVGRYKDEYHAAQVYNMVSEEIFGKGCSFLELNDVSDDYSNILRKGRFFEHWLPLMIKEKERLYEQE